MADLSKLTDAELMELAGQGAPKGEAAAPSGGVDLSGLSDEELNQLAHGIEKPQAEKGFWGTVGDVVDRPRAVVTSGLNELLRTENEFAKPKPSFFGNLFSAGKAALNQVTESSDNAPTFKDIAVNRLGVSDKPFWSGAQSNFAAAKAGIDPSGGVSPEQITQSQSISPADLVGVVGDQLSDPLNYVPVGAVAKLGGRAAKGAVKAGMEGIEKLPLIGGTAKGVEKALTGAISPKIAEHFGELAEVAAKNGIDLNNAPEALKYGKDSFISRGSRVLAEGAFGEPRLERFRKFMGDVTGAFDQKVATIAQGAPLSRVDAGISLRQGFDKSLDNLFDTVGDTTYNQVTKSLPGLKLNEEAAKSLGSKLNGIRKFALGRVERGLSAEQVEQGQRLINAVDAIERTNGSVKQAVEALKDLGDIAFKSKNSLAAIPPDIAKSRDLYFSLRDAITDTIRRDVQGGEQIAGALEISNSMINDFFKTSDSIGNVLGNPKLAPEQVFERLTKNTDQIKALQKLMPEEFAKIKGAYIENLIGPRTEDGLIKWTTLRNSLENRANKDVVNAMFSPAERKELDDIIKLAEKSGIAVMSTSGTGASQGFWNMLKDLPAKAVLEGSVEFQKKRAGLNLPAAAQKAAQPIRFGPAGIGPKEAIGLRLPQQISIQQQNEERRKSK